MIKDIYLIQASHTDIGYTSTQGRILRWYYAFTRQAIEFAEKNPDFRWTCESFIQVEQFWQRADDDWRKRFVRLVREGRIGLSANWANFAELPDEAVFGALAARARHFADEHKLPLNAATLADINGCPLAYARALADTGVTFLMMHVNAWHGRVLLRKRMHPFWWDLGDGRKLLVYYNEHYHFGNELGFFPGAEANATNFREPITAFDDDILERRLTNYIQGMEHAGWPHDYLIITGSGLITDNSPPSDNVTGRVARWNADPAHTAKVRMVTASDLHEILTAKTSAVPTFSGDWTDWWADGVAGDPEGTMLYRQAQRDRRWLSAASLAFPKTAVGLHSLDTALGLYAEHTFGHSASVALPWKPLVQRLHVRKLSYAADATDIAESLVDQVAESFGYGPLSYDRPLHFVVVNPHDVELSQLVEIELEACEAHLHQLLGTFSVVDSITNQVLPQQSQGGKVSIQVSVNARSRRELYIRKSRVDLVLPFEISGANELRDLPPDSGNMLSTTVETDHGHLEWDSAGCLMAWSDRTSGRTICTTHREAFVLELNRTVAAKETTAQCSARCAIGQNRQGAGSQQFIAKPSGFRRLGSGPLFDVIGIDYEAPGFEFLKAEWTVYRQLPMVDIEVICHKLGTWDLENVYCPLPFTAGDGSTFWIDRGWAMRPWRDQLPGTMTDYYGGQEGMAWCADGFGVAVAMLDCNLIHCGDLRYRTRLLMGDKDLPSTPDHVYAWLMTNNWSTNFSAELGGFYSFRFRVSWGPHLADPTAALRWARLATGGLKIFRQAKYRASRSELDRV